MNHGSLIVNLRCASQGGEDETGRGSMLAPKGAPDPELRGGWVVVGLLELGS